VLAPSEEKSDDSEDRICKELEQVFDHFPKYHMKILLGDVNAKLWREGIFNLTVGNEGLRQDIKDDGFRIVNLTI
jgi:F420-0:gamma-glutamyl ligase